MKLVLVLLALLAATVLARPQYKDIDYKLYNDDAGVAIDSVYEVINEKPPDAAKHHHHHHHKKLVKSNRLDRLKRYLRNNF